jgi:hypothetical protein
MQKNPRPRGSGIFIFNQRDSMKCSEGAYVAGPRDPRPMGRFLELDCMMFAPLPKAFRTEVGGG